MIRAPLKMIGLLKRRPGLSLEQFSRHWRTIHRDLALRLVGPGIMLGYTQNHRLAEGSGIEGIDLAGDGFPELWISDAQALTRIAEAPEYRTGAYHDEANFMDGRSRAIVAREHVIRGGSGPIATATQVKAMLFFDRAPGVTAARFSTEFMAVTAPLQLPAATPLRLTRHLSIDMPLDTGSENDAIQMYAGVESSYWANAASFHAAWQMRDAAGSEAQSWRVKAGVLVHEEPVLIPAHAGPLLDEYVGS